MEEEATAIVVVPFPAQGHLNQALHFSLRLAARGFPVHFASSASHNRQAKDRLQGWDPSLSLDAIRFHDLHAPPFPTPPPNPNSSSRFPAHLVPSFHASLDLRAPLGSLLRSLSASCRRLVVINDPLMSFAGCEAAGIPNAESYRFQCVPTFNELPHFLDPGVQPAPTQEALDVIFSQFDGALPADFWAYLSRVIMDPVETGTLFNSCRAIEGEFFDLAAKVPRYHGKLLFAVGPLSPTVVVETGGPRERHRCLEWLDRQPEDSVVYVSFGSTVTLSDEQIEQLAVGLKSSGQRFIWVLRDADRGDIYDDDGEAGVALQRELPPGSEQGAEEVGMVVRGWAPQLEILAHRATGAFMSHCGWNSCMESLSMGVPMIAWPMHSDQPRNAKMVTDYLKAGVAVGAWGRHEAVVPGDEIGEVIRRVMVGEEGGEIRKRARLLGEEARIAVAEGGSSAADLDSFVAHIRR